jgi:hypothetical protein
VNGYRWSFIQRGTGGGVEVGVFVGVFVGVNVFVGVLVNVGVTQLIVNVSWLSTPAALSKYVPSRDVSVAPWTRLIEPPVPVQLKSNVAIVPVYVLFGWLIPEAAPKRAVPAP